MAQDRMADFMAAIMPMAPFEVKRIRDDYGPTIRVSRFGFNSGFDLHARHDKKDKLSKLFELALVLVRL
jgi:hypothetical protein